MLKVTVPAKFVSIVPLGAIAVTVKLNGTWVLTTGGADRMKVSCVSGLTGMVADPWIE